MKFVIAGNRHEFLSWLDETKTSFSEARYISERQLLYGLTLTPENVVRYGTYYARPDIDEIEQEITYRMKR